MYKGFTFIMDIDGTICPIKKKEERYEDLVPYSEVLEKLRYYKNNGAKIVLHTSRNMNSYNGNIGLINKTTARILMAWLDKWQIPYDEIIYGKPWPGQKGFYVDDRTIRPNEFLKHTPEELEKICADSRCLIQENNGEKNKLDIVITMGGLGNRFQSAGYTLPKYMIEAKGRTLFEWSLASLEGFRDSTEQYIFIVRNEDGIDVKEFIEEKCNLLGIERYQIITLDHVTDGQATTALLAKKYWKKEHGLLIYNIDTYVEEGEMKASDLKGDGFIPCFKALGDHWSFVRLEKGEVVEIREKERISDNCTLGAYYFRTCDLYERLYYEYYERGKGIHQLQEERYVAPLYNHLLKMGGSIYISDISPFKVHVLGTPEELQHFLEA